MQSYQWICYPYRDRWCPPNKTTLKKLLNLYEIENAVDRMQADLINFFPIQA